LGPASEAASVAPSPSRLENLVGRKISHYRILQVLGGGGMGIVYQAEDLKLGRRVAIKFLPAEMRSDAKAFARIEREARAASALEHPSICPIYELGEHEGQPFIVMQLLEGQTLREWIEASAGISSAQRLRALLKLGVQIADGLQTAHQKGIIHRDIKPANLFITTRGEAKILDFGVAKFLDAIDVAGDASLDSAAPIDKIAQPPSALPGRALTETGASMGTPCYASPEQVRGDKLDARTDLFSFGLVLYEAATGRQAFVGNTATEIRDAVINQPAVPVRQVNPELPAALERIVSKALEKDREQRYRSAADLRQDLQGLQHEVDSSLADPGTSTHTSATAAILRHRKTAVVTRTLIAVALLLAAGFGVYSLLNRTGSQPFKDFTVTQITNTGKAELAAISPDGKYVLHLQNDNGRQSLRLRNIATGSDTQIVAPTPARYTSLVFSPDGNYVYFRQLINSIGSDWDVYRMPVLGGTQQLIARDVDSDITFSPDARQLAYVRANDPEVGKYRLLSANPDGSAETILAIENIEGVGNEAYPPFAAWSGDGKEIAYSYAKMTDQPGAIKAFDLASSRLSVLERFPSSLTFELCWPSKRNWLMLLHTENGPNFASPQIAAVSVQNGKLYPVTRDTNSYSTLTLSADGKTAATVQVKITETLDLLPVSGESTQTAAGSQLDDVSAFDWSSDEKLIVSDGSQLLRVGRDDVKEVALASDPGAAVLSLARCSNSYVLVSWAYYGGRHDRAIWRINADGSDPKQLSSGSYDIAPSCSPDGHWAYYVDGLRTLMRVPVDGGRPEIVPGSKIPNSDRLLGSGDFSPDGRGLVLIADTYDPVSQEGRPKLAIIALDSTSASASVPRLLEPHPGIVSGSLYSGGARFSPDGKSVVYVIRENGIGNLWMQPIDGAPGHQITKFTSGLIAGFRWSPDRKTLAVMRTHKTSDVVVLRDTTE
jgi:serine/threonine protein kinase